MEKCHLSLLALIFSLLIPAAVVPSVVAVLATLCRVEYFMPGPWDS